MIEIPYNALYTSITNVIGYSKNKANDLGRVVDRLVGLVDKYFSLTEPYLVLNELGGTILYSRAYNPNNLTSNTLETRANGTSKKTTIKKIGFQGPKRVVVYTKDGKNITISPIHAQGKIKAIKASVREILDENNVDYNPSDVSDIVDKLRNPR